MLKLIKELFQLLTKSQKKRLLRLQFLVLISSIGEIIGVASIAPFISMVSDFSSFKNNRYINYIYNEFQFKNELDFIFYIGLLVLISLILSTLLSIISTKKMAMFAAEVGTENADRLYKYYLNKNWLFHTQISSSKLIKQIANEAVRVTDLVILPLILLNSKLVLVTLIICGWLIYNPFIALIGIITFSLLYIIVFSIAKNSLSKNGLTLSKEATNRYRLMNEGFGGIKDIIILNRQNFYTDQFRKSGRKFAHARGNNHVLWQIPKYFMEFIAFGTLVGTILFFISNEKSNLTYIIPQLSFYALAAFKILPALQQIYASIGQVKGNLSAFESIQRDLKNSLIFENKEDKLININEEFYLEKSIRLNNVYFKYPNKKQYAINNLSINIKSNSLVGLVGTSGSGKSTILDLILGMIPPNKGNVSIDDNILSEKNYQLWQKNIGLVSQDIFLTEGSIAENIAFGLNKKEINKNLLNEAIKLAQLEEIISSLEQGINTIIGERGIQLSGGQRQRLGIARALYRNNSVLIFDEATSSLDGNTEKSIMSAINNLKGKKTIIIVAHRLKTIHKCDEIFFIENGKLFDSGTYEYLINNNEKFKNLSKNA